VPTPPPDERSGQVAAPVALLVPVKAFGRAKLRLSGVLDPEERADLARRMAAVVLAAAGPLPAHVVCDDDEVASWAASAGATVLWRPGFGLDQAVADGVAALRAEGYRRVVVAHADLPLARDLRTVAAFAGVTIVPDRREDGTNVICVPADAGFTFAYGAGSFRRHAAEAVRLGLGLRVVRRRDLGFDVDLPGDLEEAGRTGLVPTARTSAAGVHAEHGDGGSAPATAT
jgi:2-phospho-L-lactate guanylyltransferase